MKRIFIIFLLFGLILNISAQKIIRADDAIIEDAFEYRGVDIEDWFSDSSGATIGADNGLEKIGNTIGIGGTLNRNTAISGNNYNYTVGDGSNVNLFRVNSSGGIILDSDSDIRFSTIFGGNYNFKDYVTSTRPVYGADSLAWSADTRNNLNYQLSLIRRPFEFKYSSGSSFVNGRPGVGEMRANDFLGVDITQLYLDDYAKFDMDQTINNGLPLDISNNLQLADSGSILYIYNRTASEEDVGVYEPYYAFFRVNSVIDSVGYTTLNVDFISENEQFYVSGDMELILEINSYGTNAGGTGSLDSLYFTDTKTWITDTIPISDSARNTLTASDSIMTPKIKFTSSGSSMTNIPQNDIFMWDSTNSNYEPYPTSQANSFYLGTSTPTGTTRLNYDGYLYATALKVFNGAGISSQSSTTIPVQGISYGTGITAGQFVSNADNVTASFNVAGWASSGTVTSNVVEISRSPIGTGNLTGNIIDVTDNTATSGTVAGAVLSATIDATERISLNPRSTTTGTAYLFDTDLTLTTGTLFDVKNQGTSFFKLTPSSVFIGDATYTNSYYDWDLDNSSGYFDFKTSHTSGENTNLYIYPGNFDFQATDDASNIARITADASNSKISLITNSGQCVFEDNGLTVEKISSDTNIIGGDTITGFTPAKAYIESETFDNILLTKGLITDNDATPDVSGGSIFTYNGTANAVTVTDFDSPVIGNIYTIIGNSDTYTITINDSGNFNLSANWVGGVDDVITIYVQSDNDYIEISRSDN